MVVRRFVRWVRSNADAVTALLGGSLIGLIALVDVDLLGTETVSSAVLLVLALLATSVLRDRQSASRAAKKASELQVLHGSEVRDELTEARRSTDEWRFRGGTATYLRAVTMPDCVANARAARKAFGFQIEIIDPTNDKMCEPYARLRTSLAPGPDGTGEAWTPGRARKEAYATLLAACMHMREYSFLRVDLALSSRATGLRWDMSDRCVVETQEDPRSPALMIRSGTPLYTNYRRERVAARPSGRRVLAWTQGHAVDRDDPEVLRLRHRLESSAKRVLQLWAPLLCWVALARGDIDGFVGYRAEAIDLPAGLLIAEEAGISVRGLNGASFDPAFDAPPAARSFIAADAAIGSELAFILAPVPEPTLGRSTRQRSG